jgi:hypothetical protein
VMTAENTDVGATQLRGSVETLAGRFRKDHVRIAYDRTPEPRLGGQNTKRDEGTPRIVPRSVVADQWLCFLLGLICVICGVCGLFMKYAANGLLLRSTAIACFVVGAVLVRCGLVSPDQSLVAIGQKPLR